METQIETETDFQELAVRPAHKKFVAVLIMTNNATEAVRQAFPDLAAHSSYGYLRVKAHRMITNDNIQRLIALELVTIEGTTGRAVERLGELIQSKDGRVAFQAAKFCIEQTLGKPGRRKEPTEPNRVHVTMDLSSGRAGDPPSEVIEQIEGRE